MDGDQLSILTDCYKESLHCTAIRREVQPLESIASTCKTLDHLMTMLGRLTWHAADRIRACAAPPMVLSCLYICCHCRNLLSE